MLEKLQAEVFSLNVITNQQGPILETCFRYYTSPIHKFLDKISQLAHHLRSYCNNVIDTSKWLKFIYKFIRFVVISVSTFLKLLLYVTIFPLGFFVLSRKIALPYILPAQRFHNLVYGPQGTSDEGKRNELIHNLERVLSRRYESTIRVGRTPIQVDNISIDAITIVSKPSSNRWILISSGNEDCYETTIQGLIDETNIHIQRKESDNADILYMDSIISSSIIDWAQQIDANVMFYNYPGLALSEGQPSVSNLAKAHRGCFNYLLDGVNGPGTKEILCYGFSLGGSVQAESLYKMSKEEKSKVKLVVTDRTGYDLSLISGRFMARAFSRMGFSRFYNFIRVVVSFLFKLTGLNMKPYERNKHLTCPELYMVATDEQLNIRDDGVFDATSSYAVACAKEANESIRSRKHQVSLIRAVHMSGFDSKDLAIQSYKHLTKNDD